MTTNLNPHEHKWKVKFNIFEPKAKTRLKTNQS